MGAYKTGIVGLPKGLPVQVRGTLARRRRGKVTVVITNVAGRPLRGATVRAKGAGIRRVRRRTGRKGTATFRLRPARRGAVKFLVSRKGHRGATGTLLVR